MLIRTFRHFKGKKASVCSWLHLPIRVSLTMVIVFLLVNTC